MRLIDLSVIHEILNKIEQAALIATPAGDILFGNKKFFDMYDLTPEKVADRKVYEKSLGITTKNLFEYTIQKARENNGKYIYDRDLMVNGKVNYSEATLISFEMFGKERLLYIFNDMTDLKLSQIEAEELNTMLHKIIDNLPVYLFVKDVDNDLRYIIWNKAFAAAAKIPAEKVIGKTDFEVFPDLKDAQSFRNDDMRVIMNGEMTRKQETYMAADGITRVVQTYKTLVHRQERGPLLVGISLDVTDIHGIEEQLVKERLRAEESDRLKSRFLANMSHEIRTPLNAIVGFAGMLPDAEDDETRRQFNDIISDNSELLLQLINDILDLSRIEAGTLEYTRLPMDLFDTFHNLYPVYKEKTQYGVKLYFDNEESHVKFIIREDRNRLLQVMENLLTNAVKFTSQGEIHYGYIVKDDWIEVYVSDTGIGIPNDKLDVIFDRFVKLDNFAQGTGLGLSICKLIVETLGGEMKVASEENKGSRFSFTIPYKNDKKYNPTIPVDASPAIRNVDDKEDKTILVAEDVHSNFLVVKTMIKGRYNTLWAKDGVEAVEMAREKKPDLILMDITMPKMNGLDAAREIRKFDDEVPIVALTANAFKEDRIVAKQAGMDNFLSKPINRDAFEAVLLAYL